MTLLTKTARGAVPDSSFGLSAIRDNAVLDAVHGRNAKVTLTRTVEYWDERALAGTTAWAARGVTSVTNDIRVH